MGWLSSKKSTTVQQTDNYNLNQNVQAQGPALVGDGVTLKTYSRTTDHGAIDAARSVSMAALDTGGESLKRAYSYAENIGAGVFDFADSALSDARQGNRDALSFADSLFQGSVNAMAEAASVAKSATDNALEFAFNATRNETENAANQIFDYLKVATIAAGVVMVIRGLK